MAGLGRKEFNSGDILLASEVQGYLQDQAVMVFDDATARGSAIPSPTEGMLTYNKDTDQLELYDGAAFGPVGSDAGLIHIETQSGTSTSGINFNNVFSSDFENYKLIASVVQNSANSIRFRLRNAGTDATGSNYKNHSINIDGGGGLSGVVTTGTSLVLTADAATIGAGSIDIGRPFVATYTSMLFLGGVNSFSRVGANFHELNQSYDGFSITSVGTFTGSISIYGYRN